MCLNIEDFFSKCVKFLTEKNKNQSFYVSFEDSTLVFKKSEDSIIRYREPRGSRSLSYTLFIGQVSSKPTRLFTFLSFVHRRDGAQVPEEFYHLQLHRWDRMCWSSAQRWLHSKHLQLTLEVECLTLVQLCTCFIDNLLFSHLYLLSQLKNMLSMPNERTHFVAMK